MNDINIDELLNSYIDGELTQEQQIEVRRLIADDDQIAQAARTCKGAKCWWRLCLVPRHR